MLIYPAIDIRAGRCVRLVEGRLDRETVYSDDPAAMAGLWQEKGARWLHVVDLDGAFSGSPKNIDVIKKIRETVSIPIQVGGGIRDLKTVEELLSIGINRVILGTVAINSPDMVAEACKKYGEAVAVGIDARDGKVAIEGWGVTAEKNALDLALEMKTAGIKRIIYTDIWRDGTLQGPNVDAVREMARNTGIGVIASGGISTLDDLRSIKKMERMGVEGVIVGKSLYDGRVALEEALSLADLALEENAC
ncbi:MAG: 1-(5-phosphoribosyl)-5-[(5-phosphoribosylamino)methylideneamino] imidazole-4-carboxamide isomerase [Peptococcaceae bacterium BICA1-7]|nr:MAG: 1-(5-phosphoribosyl)-5-[(5-phosphoribosylamino)methylideneamino] imidazole-4-carboxamide isomerase [Peptococcaceae bacterium BICA1-7]HBV96650.1 1-(5-phosphoribosyl)-5-[(5-phosphoribosylamino)methylideneamino]imidazole-4-carboxamide isomerase [Desulfotomaculum sp.]